MDTVTVNGAELAYVEAGAGDPVVLVHGGINDHRVWWQQMGAFSSRYHAVAPSCRHFHPNPPIAEGATLSLETLAHDIASFLLRLDLAPAHLVGSSSGAFVCLMVARWRPELVRSLVLAEPPVLSLLGTSVPPKPRQIVRLLFRSPSAAWALVRFGATGIGPALRSYDQGEDGEAIRRFTRGVLGRRDASALSGALRDQIQDNARTFGAQLRAGLPTFEPSDARAVDAPTLLVTGERSARIHHHVADRLEALLPRVERFDLADASHLMFHDRPAVFNERALAFLG